MVSDDPGRDRSRELGALVLCENIRAGRPALGSKTIVRDARFCGMLGRVGGWHLVPEPPPHQQVP